MSPKRRIALILASIGLLGLSGCSSLPSVSRLPPPSDSRAGLFIYIDHSDPEIYQRFCYYRLYPAESTVGYLLDPEAAYGLFFDSKLGSRAITTIESAYARSGKISRQNFKYVDFTLKPHTITILNLKFGTSMHPGADGSLWQYYSFSLMSQSDYKKSVALIKALPGAENWKIDIPLASDYIENCKTGSPDEVAYDLGTGMSTDSRDSEGWTPLMVASAYNVKPEVVEVLLKAGSDVNAADTRGRTPLMAAAMTNPNPAVIRALLGSKADLYARDREGLTVLQEAARYQQNPEILGLLIGAGANLDGKAPDGETVLMLAARYNQNPDVVLALLNAGADATARDPDGKTALDYARENSNLEGSEALAALEKATD